MDKLISELVSYGITCGLIEEADQVYVTKRLSELFRLNSYISSVDAVLILADILQKESSNCFTGIVQCDKGIQICDKNSITSLYEKE